MALASYEAVTSPFEVLASPSTPASVDGMFSLGLPESATKRPFWHSTSQAPGGWPERLRRVALVSLSQRCSVRPTSGAGLASSLPVAPTVMGVCRYLSPHVPP